MGSLRLTLCATALTVTAFTPAALIQAALTPAAHAADGGSVSVTPSSPAPGAEVALRVSGCTGRTATAASAAFVADARLTGGGADGTLAGQTQVRSSIEPGSYDVKITCVDFEVKGTITVGTDKPGKQNEPRPNAPTTPASPIAPVLAGGGGTARLAAADTADARPTGPGTGHTVTGLVLAGVAALAVVLLGSRRSRRTD
ncbi:hypothetical protein K4B79_38910 [Streptomyces lincolnensis]|uniref:hypothetical protein n=1 Tax=Streptomyces lincolnensis TaxID=1915 RepID=UPI001E4118C2|nr:hypothetical protein [Streptomyces lincolnensis]MCD7444166.1 hypothetical protein [Streptomyces lincolnensis]